MRFDVIVIGLGLSGLMAAKTASEAGRRVLIVGKGIGSLGILSNTVDILGRASRDSLKEDVLAWIGDNPRHPYALAGWQGIEEALRSFVSLFPPPYDFSAPGGRNSLIPTGAGTRHPAYLVPATMLGGIDADWGKTLIVGFEGFKDFFAEYVAHHLKARGITIPLPRADQGGITATAIARLMEEPGFTGELAYGIKKRWAGEEAVGLPALLGVRSPAQVLRELESETKLKVFEIPILPPSIPGMRVFNRFKGHLLARGVRLLQGQAVVSVLREGRRIKGVTVYHAPLSRTFTCEACILATGRFLGGGLLADEEGIREPVFDLPLKKPSSRGGWFNKRFFSTSVHPLHFAGVMVNEKFQPVDGEGKPVFENLRAAGTIMACHSSIEETSREGIEIASGYAAARRACEL